MSGGTDALTVFVVVSVPFCLVRNTVNGAHIIEEILSGIRTCYLVVVNTATRSTQTIFCTKFPDQDWNGRNMDRGLLLLLQQLCAVLRV